MAGAVVTVGLLIGGAWWLLDSTVPVGDYEDVVADMLATEADLATAKAEVVALTDEVESLTARNAQLDMELSAMQEPSSPSGESDLVQWVEDYDDARTRLFQSRTAQSGEFDLVTDSLCLWFTPDVMNDIVLVAASQSGTSHEFEEFGSVDCRQQPGSSARWQMLRTADGSDEFRLAIELGPVAADGRRGGQLPNRVEPADFVPPVLSWASPPSSTALSDPVRYGNLTYRSGLEEGVSMQLRVEGREDDVLFFRLGVSDSESAIEPVPPWPSNRYEWLAYGVVNLMLEQMGWIECPTTWCD